MITVQPVALEYVNMTWPLVERYINDALTVDTLGESCMSVEHLRVKAVSGQSLLCVAVDENNKIHGALLVSFRNEPLHRVACVVAIGGRHVSNHDTMAQLKAILKMNGATLIQAHCRPAIARLWRRYDFKPTYTTMEHLL